jgi:hypothetical protein
VRFKGAGLPVISDEPLDGALREDDWGRAYGCVSGLLHVSNPYDQPADVGQMPRQLARLNNELVKLLDYHTLQVSDRDYLLGGMLNASGKATVKILRIVTDRPLDALPGFAQ